MTVTIDICVQNDPENMCRTACCDFYFIVTFCDLTLTWTLLSMPFILMQYPSCTFTQHFG